MVQETAYFREFLDFGYLWMLDNGKDVPRNYQPRPENEALWLQLKEVLDTTFFERCPMHWLGNLLGREEASPPRITPLVLVVSLEPGRPKKVEKRECDIGLFNQFGGNGGRLINDCSQYFPKIYGQGGLSITGNPFWRIISRITYRAFNDVNFENHQCLEWMSNSVVHVDLWPLRSPTHGVFLQNQVNFPKNFKLEHRYGMIRELIGATMPDLVLLLGEEGNLALDDWNLLD